MSENEKTPEQNELTVQGTETSKEAVAENVAAELEARKEATSESINEAATEPSVEQTEGASTETEAPRQDAESTVQEALETVQETASPEPEPPEPWKIPRDELKMIVEGLIFVSGRVLGLSAICRAVPDARQKEIKEVLAELIHDWSDINRGFHLVEINNGFQFRSNPRCAMYVREMLKSRPLKLTRAALETLAIIAYRQPITRAEIEDIRGVDVGGVLKMLLEKKFVRILGKREEPGRPMIYGTSREFLETFHLNSLKDLPTLQEFQELTEEDRARVETVYPGKKEEPEPSETVEPEEDPLFVVQPEEADSSQAARELAKAAADLELAVKSADEAMTEILGRVPYDQQTMSLDGEAVAEVEVLRGAPPAGDKNKKPVKDEGAQDWSSNEEEAEASFWESDADSGSEEEAE